MATAAAEIMDWELELAVLDCLTDVVLPNCGSADEPTRARLVSVLTEGANRPSSSSTRGGSGVGDHREPFAHVCLRKLFVLCSRGGRAADSGAAISVGRIALPALVTRCEAVLIEYAATDAAAPVDAHFNRRRVDLVVCVLDIVVSLTLDPRVSDAAARGHASFEGNVGIATLLQWLRKALATETWATAGPGAPRAPDAPRERAHLFLLYRALVSCVATREPQVRERVQDALRLVGCELGLITEGSGSETAAEREVAAETEARGLLPADGRVIAFE
eukprot:CAMPEP_0181348412 /NCGR_PEP_ID=MMETSP1106-20121128/160_1 /TAXON_ID=81844 /ORGANISM="Mantoniella antarctica, Strain SL-175" /LENGTH=275 /DNA_ID=CAMNT_0023460699 /DNA_START=185 /DNA_END=1011 /DNA_ORIENTATION=-